MYDIDDQSFLRVDLINSIFHVVDCLKMAYIQVAMVNLIAHAGKDFIQAATPDYSGRS